MQVYHFFEEADNMLQVYMSKRVVLTNKLKIKKKIQESEIVLYCLPIAMPSIE